jgi:ubiquitin-protein ligase
MQIQTPCNKRITREITYIRTNMQEYHVSELTNKNDKNTTYIEIITPNYNRLIFKLPNNYPFKPPLSLECNGNNYRYSINNMPTRIKYLYNNPGDIYFENKLINNKFSNIKCLCCTSLLCSDNWSPAYTLYNILDEITKHNDLKRHIMYKLMLKLIFYKLNFPLELVLIIFNFL